MSSRRMLGRPASGRSASAWRRWAWPALAWPALALGLGLGALLGLAAPHESIDWQPALAASQPWRAFTAIGVHYSDLHLAGNLAGALLAAIFGVVAQAPPRLALAWLAAWPLTHVALLVEPRLAHYGGLSGVLHAGAAAVVVWMLARGTPAQRGVAAAIGLGLVAKLVGEAPWAEALRYPAAWDIATAPLAHATGALAGALCAVLALWGRTGPAARTAGKAGAAAGRDVAGAGGAGGGSGAAGLTAKSHRSGSA